MQYKQTEIAKRIKRERDERGWSKNRLAELLNVNRNTITIWESHDKGGRVPPLGDMLNMCELFNCELAYLLGEIDCKTRVATDIQAATGLSEVAIYHIKHLSGIIPSQGNEFLNRLFDAGFVQVLVELQSAYRSYKRAKNAESVALDSDKGKAWLYEQMVNTLQATPHESGLGYNMRIDVDGYLDLRLRQISEHLRDILKEVCKKQLDTLPARIVEKAREIEKESGNG